MIAGQIIPAVLDVKLTMTVESDTPFVLETFSDSRGEYQFPAIPSSSEFHVSASKEGFVFHVSPDGLNFSHQQLGSIRIVVQDLEGVPIEGVLLALSNEATSYTGVSREDGSAVFGPLFPGNYYLHSQLKEYRFSPAGQTVEVLEGKETVVDIRGERVAFSVFGSVVTLTGQPLARMKLLAESTSGTRETTSTDLQGTFRLRGLKPGEFYSIRVVGEEHVLPAVKEVQMSSEDVRNADFVCLREEKEGRLVGVVESDGAIPEGMKVIVEQGKSRKVMGVSLGGTFEVSGLKEGEVNVHLEGKKVSCEPMKTVIEKNEINQVVMHCQVEQGEMEVANGGSFILLAVATIALFVFLERDLFN